MVLGRKLGYAMILFGFYTFIIVFSLELKMFDVVVPVVFITVISYGWFLFAIMGMGPVLLDFQDLMIQVFIYSFISFSIVFSSLFLSQHGFDKLRLFLLSSPVVIWILIWIDFYFQRMKGNL